MKKRIISAIAALIIAVPLVYFGGIPFYLLALVLGLIAMKEILDLIEKDDYLVRLVSYINFLFLVGSGIIQNDLSKILDRNVLGIVLLIFGVLFLLKHKSDLKVQKFFCLVGITLFLSVAFSALIVTRNMSLTYFIYIFLITIMTDTFAHSIGTLFGKHKINEISPNKSWKDV